MGRHAKDSGTDFVQPPTGTHVSRCYKLIDIGTHHNEYQGKMQAREQFIMGWELPEELMEDTNEPFLVSGFFTNSLHEKSKLRPFLESWRGRTFSEEELDGFDLNALLGAACMLTIIANPNGRHVVQTAVRLPKNVVCKPQVNPSLSFWIEEWNEVVFQSLSPKIQDLITSSDEYKAMQSKGTGKSVTEMPERMGTDEYSYPDEEIP